mgnify:FL=1
MDKQTPQQRHQLAFLGAALLVPDEAKVNVMRMNPAMFDEGALREIFTAIYQLCFEGKGIDPLTVASRAGDQHRQLIMYAAQTCPSISHLDDYETLVVEDWRQRLLQEAIAAAQLSGESSDALCSRLRAALNVQDAIAAQQLDSSAQEFDAVLDRTVKALRDPDTTLKTGWAQVDEFGLLERTNTVVLAGRPGCGKTDFAINLAARLSKKYRVYYLTLEETDVKLMSRILSKATRIDAGRMRDKKLTTEEYGIIEHAKTAMQRHHNMVLEDGSNMTVDGIRARLLKHKPDVAFVDHIGLIVATDPRAKEYERLSDITRQLKVMAVQLGIVIVELCQLNRQVVRGGGAYATLADLRGSGTIEQDANGVIFVRNLPAETSDTLHDTNDYRESGILVGKNRGGGLGEVRMQWRPQYHDWLPERSIYPQDEGGNAGPVFPET